MSNSKINIAFLSDSSIRNPILFSQGIPLFEYLTTNGYNAYFITLERHNDDREELNLLFEKVNSIGIKTFPIFFFKSKFIPGLVINFTQVLFIIFFFIIKNKITIINCRSFLPTILSNIVKLFIKIKVVYDTRGAFLDEQVFLGNWKHNGLKIKICRKIETWLIKRSDHIVVVTDVQKELIKSSHEVSNVKLTVINNKLNIEKELIVNEKNSKYLIGVYSGSDAKWQNLSNLFSLMNVGINEFSIFKFRCYSYLPEQFFSFNKNNICEILKVNSDDVHKKLMECNFGIMIREQNLINKVASPLKFAEYLNAGLPVLLSQGIGDTEQIVKKYNVGVIVKNFNYKFAFEEIKELLKDSEIYMKCKEVAIKEFNRFDAFKSYENIYLDLIK